MTAIPVSVLTATFWKTLGQTSHLCHSRILDPQKLWDKNVFCSKPVSLGVICHTAIQQYRSQCEFSVLLAWELEKVEMTTLIEKTHILNGCVLAHHLLLNGLEQCLDEMLRMPLWRGKTSEPSLLEHIANITSLSSPRKQLNLLLANYHQEKTAQYQRSQHQNDEFWQTLFSIQMDNAEQFDSTG